MASSFNYQKVFQDFQQKKKEQGTPEGGQQLPDATDVPASPEPQSGDVPQQKSPNADIYENLSLAPDSPQLQQMQQSPEQLKGMMGVATTDKGEEQEQEKANPLASLEHMYNDLMGNLESQQEDYRSIVNKRLADRDRLASVQAGRIGSGIGGGFAGAMSQANIDNLRTIEQSEQGWADRKNQLQSQWLSDSIDQLRFDEQMGQREKQSGQDLFLGMLEAGYEGDPAALAEAIQAGDFETATQLMEEGTLRTGDVQDKLEAAGVNWEDLSDADKVKLRDMTPEEQEQYIEEELATEKQASQYADNAQAAARRWLKQKGQGFTRESTSDSTLVGLYEAIGDANTMEEAKEAEQAFWDYIERKKAKGGF